MHRREWHKTRFDIMIKPMDPDRPGYGPTPSFAGIFLCSFSALSFEITLTRVFSISLWYHFAFMVISIGMLGIGLSGTLQSLYPGLKKPARLGTYALLLGLSMQSGYVLANLIPFDPYRLSWDRLQLLYIMLYYLLLSAPFFFFGLVMSTSFSASSGKSGLLYGSDLLGAGAGAVSSLIIIGLAGPGRAVFMTSLAALLAAFIFRARLTALMAASAAALLIILNPALIQVRMSPYKELELALKHPGAEHMSTYQSGFSRLDFFKSPMARFAPGLSLGYLEELPSQVGLSIDGAGVTAVTDAGGDMEFLRHLPSALPYEIKKRSSSLVIDPRGGLQVLLAREFGVESIRSIESNPLVTEAIGKDFSVFSGGIYSRGSYTGLARSVLMKHPWKFDVIDISLTGAVPSGPFGMNEDYRFTVEAFGEYLSRLEPDGALSISLYILPPPRTELRLLSSAIKAIEQAGIEDSWRRIAAIRSWGALCILIKPSPFTPEETSRIKEFSRRNGFDLVYYPGIKKEETNIHVRMPDDAYYRAFASIINPATREEFLDGYVFNVRAVHDDRPFFHYFLRPENIRETHALAGGKWQYFIEEGYLLPFVLIQALVLSLLLIVLPMFQTKRKRTRPGAVLLYFVLLGTGFMFIEIPLIQKMILPLENPYYAVAGVLASMLISSGLGSLLSQKIRTRYMVLALAILIIPYGLLINTLALNLLPFPMPLRFFLVFLLVMPAGVLMGMPFPLGIRLLGERAPGLIPWAWAVNGCFSVLAPLLATMLAMSSGFRSVFLLGAAAYAMAFAVIKKTI